MVRLATMIATIIQPIITVQTARETTIAIVIVTVIVIVIVIAIAKIRHQCNSSTDINKIVNSSPQQHGSQSMVWQPPQTHHPSQAPVPAQNMNAFSQFHVGYPLNVQTNMNSNINQAMPVTGYPHFSSQMQPQYQQLYQGVNQMYPPQYYQNLQQQKQQQGNMSRK